MRLAAMLAVLLVAGCGDKPVQLAGLTIPGIRAAPVNPHQQRATGEQVVATAPAEAAPRATTSPPAPPARDAPRAAVAAAAPVAPPRPAARMALTRVTFPRNGALADADHLKAAKSFADKAGSGAATVECHTDAKGSPEFNHGLGMRRARSLRDALKAVGVATANVRLASLGAERIGRGVVATDTGLPGGRPLGHNRYCDMFVEGEPGGVTPIPVATARPRS